MLLLRKQLWINRVQFPHNLVVAYITKLRPYIPYTHYLFFFWFYVAGMCQYSMHGKVISCVLRVLCGMLYILLQFTFLFLRRWDTSRHISLRTTSYHMWFGFTEHYTTTQTSTFPTDTQMPYYSKHEIMPYVYVILCYYTTLLSPLNSTILNIATSLCITVSSTGWYIQV